MKYCTKCGHELADGARFCNACGAPADTQPPKPRTDDELRAEEQAVLNKFSLGLKHERLAWKIYGTTWTIFSSIFIGLGLIMGTILFILAAASGGEGIVALPLFMVYSLYGLMFMPIGIVNLSMMKKVDGYREKLYTDCNDGISHFRVGSIVFCAIFNPVALVFNIVYFIQTKNNAAVIERIKARQEAYRSQH